MSQKMTDHPGGAPYLSLAMICGNDGALTLARTLESVIKRPDGAFVDEVVIGWNGSDDAAFEKALGVPAGSLPRALKEGVVLQGLPVRIIRQKWEGDFAKARNETYAACRGEWIVYLDTDDIVSSLADETSVDGMKAVNAMCRQYGAPEFQPSNGQGGTTIRDYLRGLAYNVNCIQGAYDYLVDANGDAKVRQRVRRIVRRSAGWVWDHKIHETLYLVGPVTEVTLYQPGLLIRHYPVIEEQLRLSRNQEIAEAVEKGTGTKDSRHAFDMSTVHAASGDWDKVISDLDLALQKAQSKEDMYLYRLCKVTAALTVNRLSLATQEALAAITCFPERQEAYFAAVETFARGGEWQSVIALYEIGSRKEPVLDRVDYVESRCVNPRVRVADAHCQLGHPEKGVPLCEEALRLCPGNHTAAKTLARCQSEAQKKRAVDSVLDAIGAMLAARDTATARAFVAAAAESPALRGLVSLPRYQVLAASIDPREAALNAASRERPDWVKKLETEHPDCVVRYHPDAGPLADAKTLIEAAQTPAHPTRQVLEYAARDGGQAVVWRAAKKPAVTFHCPIGVAAWDPNYPEVLGIGGSETSAIMLARELASRGYPISMYCPGGGTQPAASKGIVWRRLNEFDPKKQEGLVIAHRAPFILRNPDMTARTFVWHQDNGYGSTWMWSPEINARSAGSLHVSDWARACLLKALGPPVAGGPGHHVIGNGVLKSWIHALAESPPKRSPHKVVFASNPTRGLDTLLNCWPHVRARVLDAELHVFCDFEAAMRISGAGTIRSDSTVPAIVELFRKLQKMLTENVGVFSRGLLPQPELTQQLFSAGVYAYPGGSMPEGFGVVLAEAAAAGCAVVFPRDGALPDVLPDDTYMVSKPVVTNESANEFLELLLDAVQQGDRTIDRKKNSLAVWERHGWPVVADRFEKAVG